MPKTVSSPNLNAKIGAVDQGATNGENRMLGITYRLLAVFFISIMFAMVKLAGQQGVHVMESLFWRQLTGLPVILLWLSFTGSLRDIGTKRPSAHALRMALGLTAMGLNYWAMTLLPLAEATTIGFSVPIFSTILAALLLREHTGAWRWSAVILGFVGILIVLRPTGHAIDGFGSTVAVIAAFATASITVVIRHMSRTETTGAIVFWFSLTSLVPLGIAMPFVATNHSALVWSYIAILSLAGAAAQICLTASLKYAPVSVVLPIDYSSLLWATIYGWLLFDMLPASTTWTGAPIIIGAGLIIVWREQRLRRKMASAALSTE